MSNPWNVLQRGYKDISDTSGGANGGANGEGMDSPAATPFSISPQALSAIMGQWGMQVPQPSPGSAVDERSRQMQMRDIFNQSIIQDPILMHLFGADWLKQLYPQGPSPFMPQRQQDFFGNAPTSGN